MSNNLGYTGTQQPGDGASEYNALIFMMRSVAARLSTATLVKVLAVTNDGGLDPVGFVDVQPLVNQVDGAGNAVPHGTIHQLPYFRLQGGADAVIIDPSVGDIGMAAFASHDISTVCTTRAQANPGTPRRFDMADGMYFGGLLNATPTQYVRFYPGGIDVVSPTKITLTAPNVEINASVAVQITSPNVNGSGTADFATDVIAAGKSGAHHTHIGHGANNPTDPPT